MKKTLVNTIAGLSLLGSVGCKGDVSDFPQYRFRGNLNDEYVYTFERYVVDDFVMNTTRKDGIQVVYFAKEPELKVHMTRTTFPDSRRSGSKKQKRTVEIRKTPELTEYFENAQREFDERLNQIYKINSAPIMGREVGGGKKDTPKQKERNMK